MCAWLSLDEVASYEEDTRLKTEEPEEEDEKECEELSGMSSASVNKLQILWDHFIHAEPQSYEVLLQFSESICYFIHGEKLTFFYFLLCLKR